MAEQPYRAMLAVISEAEDFAGGQVDDGGAGLIDDGEDAAVGVGGADAHVVHPGGPSEADFAVVVGAVVAQPEA